MPIEAATLLASLTLLLGFWWGRAVRKRSAPEQPVSSDPVVKGPNELLAAIVENAPLAVLVYGETGRISFSNREARLLFSSGNALDGENFLRLVERAPEALREGLLRPADALFSLDGEAQLETFSLARRELQLNGEAQTLLMVKELTPELGRQEVDVWKKVIRLINHELNNSLAPILSMVRSARFIVPDREQHHKLEQVFETIEERAKHLAAFLEGYARFARLPRPRPERVSWPNFVAGLRALYPQVTVGDVPDGDGYFDVGQMQQALINLLKNAIEASPEGANVELGVRLDPHGGAVVSVRDRGHGMTPEVMKNALLPFFTTKESGSGLGLALAREIVEAHRGQIRILQRDGGGIEVACWLPGNANVTAPRTASLTLTRR